MLPGDNTFDANTAIYNKHLGQKLYEGYCHGRIGSPADRTWIVHLYRIYSIRHITFFFAKSKHNFNSFLLHQFTKNFMRLSSPRQIVIIFYLQNYMQRL